MVSWDVTHVYFSMFRALFFLPWGPLAPDSIPAALILSSHYIPGTWGSSFPWATGFYIITIFSILKSYPSITKRNTHIQSLCAPFQAQNMDFPYRQREEIRNPLLVREINIPLWMWTKVSRNTHTHPYSEGSSWLWGVRMLKIHTDHLGLSLACLLPICCPPLCLPNILMSLKTF